MSREKDPPIDGNEPTLAPESLGVADTVMPDSKQQPSSTSTASVDGSYTPGGIALSVVEPHAYEISGEFARGGLGRILQARDRRLGRPVAIKELLRSHNRAADRFIREALVTARLQHPAIVPVYEAGHWPTGEPFYAMKMVNGRSLDQVIADTRSVEERLALLPVVTDVCEAIAYAHSEKVIHRDLKPANILVGSFGETVVIDWGLAKETGTSETYEPEQEQSPSEDPKYSPVDLTAVGSVMGTPAFMPPEQAQGKPVDERADVYALGAILYHLLSGLPPYGGNSSADVLKNVLSGPPLPLERLEAQVAPDLLAIIQKAMARDLEQRYPSAKELAEDLKRFQTGKLVAAHRYSPFELVRRFVQRHRAALAVAVLMLVLLIVGAVFSVVAVMRERDRANLDLLTAMGHAAQAELARIHAEDSRREAAQTADELILSEVRASLAKDPSQSVSWLKRLSPDPRHTDAMRFLLMQASARGVAEVYPLPREPLFVTFTDDPASLLLVDRGEIRRFDLKTKKLTSLLSLSSAPRLVAYSPAQARLAIADEAGDILLFSAREPVKTLPGNSSLITQLTFLPDQMLAASDQSGELRLWSLAEVKPTASVLQKFAFAISCFDVTPSGDMFAIVSNGALHLLSLRGGATPEIKLTKPATISRFSPDATQLAVAGNDGFLQLWSLTATPTVSTLEGLGTQTITSLTFSKDGGTLFAVGHRGELSLWSTQTSSLLRLVRTRPSKRITISQDDSLIVGSGDVDQLWLWDATRQEQQILFGHQEFVAYTSISNDRSLIASVSKDKTLRLWREPPLTRRFFGLEEHTARGIATSGDRLIASVVQGALWLWDVTEEAPSSLLGHSERINSLAFSPDGALLASGSQDKTIQLWDASTKQKNKTLSGHEEGVLRVVFSMDSQRLLSSDSGGVLRLWELRSGASSVLQSGTGAITALSVSPAGDLIAVASSDDLMIRLWSLKGEPLGELSGHEGEVSSMAFSPDGKWLASASLDKTVRIWDVYAKALVMEPLVHDDKLSLVRFSPNGSLLAAGCEDDIIRLWELNKSPSKMRELRGHSGALTALVFSPSGRQLASGAHDNSLRLWDTISGESQVLYQSASPIWSVSFLGVDALGAASEAGVFFWRNELPNSRKEMDAWLDKISDATRTLE